MTGTMNFLIWGKETGRSGRIWRNQAWGGSGSSSSTFAQPLLFDTLKKGCSSPDAVLDVVDFPWSPPPKLNKTPSLSNITNEIHKSLVEFDEMLDEFETDDDEKNIFSEAPTSLNTSRSLCNALHRSASKNLLMRRSSSGLRRIEVTSNEDPEVIYDTIDDNANPESGYTTAEHESSASNSITSASSGISGMAERRRQTCGPISENFVAPTDSYVEDPYETNEVFSSQNYQSRENYLTDETSRAVEDSVNRESSFDYEAIMRKKKPKTFLDDEGLGLTGDELTRLNKLLQDDESSTNTNSQNRNDNDFSSTYERSNTFVYQANPGGGERPRDTDIGYPDYLNSGEIINRTEENDYSSEFNEEENSSRLSNPSTLTNATPVFHVPPPPDFTPPPPNFVPPPPPDFIPPPPPNFIPPPPPQLSSKEEEQDDDDDDDTLRRSGEDEYNHLDGMENYTINFGEEAEASEAEVDEQPMTYDDQPFEYQEQPDETNHYDYVQSDDPPPPPSEDFPWTAADDPVEDDGDASFPAPPPAPPPPPCDWSPPRSQPIEISALKESLSNVKLRKVSDEELSSRTSPKDGVSDAVGMIANLILSGAYKLKPTAAGAALRNDQKNETRDNTDSTTAQVNNSDDTLYLNASEVDKMTSHDVPSRPPIISQKPPTFGNQQNQNVISFMSPKENSSKTESNEIDVSKIPGYQTVPESAAPWKRDLIERKNQKLIEKYMEEKENRKLDEDKWKDVPQWKKDLLIEKEKKKNDNPVVGMFKSKQPPVVMKKSEAVIQWKQRHAQNQRSS